jgi:hypothetical protein
MHQVPASAGFLFNCVINNRNGDHMMNLLELQTKDPKSMTKEELEQTCMQLLAEMNDILDIAHERNRKEQHAKSD